MRCSEKLLLTRSASLILSGHSFGLLRCRQWTFYASCYGIIPLSWSFDHTGPFARSVEDCALMLDALAGHDPRDPANLPDSANKPEYAAALQAAPSESAPLIGIRVGVPRNDYFAGIDPEVGAAVEAAIKTLERLGAQVESVALPDELNDLFGAYRGVQMPEATLAHIEAGWWAARAADYGSITHSRLEMGSKMSAMEYIKAQRLRQAFAQRMRAVMQQIDLLALPILPPRRDQLDQPIRLGDHEYEPDATMLRFTFPFNLTGQPALFLPCGFSTSGLPIGLQLAGRHHEETTTLRTGHTYQQATDWHLRQPS